MGWIAVVLNDSSGTGECAAAAKQLEEIFSAAGRAARVTVARGGHELRDAAQRAAQEGCDIVVAGGGDGTVNTLAAVALEHRIPLGVLPMGTLNHFAKDLEIPLELEEAAKVILDGAVCEVDAGEVNGRPFVNNSSLGVYPAIVRMRERYQATGWGKWLAAGWATLAVLRRRPFMAVRISIDNQTVVRRTPFVFVGNNEYHMSGLNAGARESLAQGNLAIYMMNAERRLGLLRLAWQLFRKGVDEVKELDLITTQEAVIETRQQRLQVALDGEVVPLEAPLNYRIHPRALRVCVPASATACYPHQPGPSSSR